MNLVKETIEHCSKFTRLHVRVRAVRDRLVSGELAVKARILFIGTDLEVGILRGFLHQYTEPPTGVLLEGAVADIYYDRRQPIEWQRLVCCKELLHLLDPENYKTNTPAGVKDLIEKIALPPGISDIKTDGAEVWGDKLKDLQATAVLFPMAAREILLEPYRDEKISAENIARIARLPEKYVRWVMSDEWQRIYPLILEL